MNEDKEKSSDKSKNDSEFRAVVKRLLDTPPMHKAKSKPSQNASRKTTGKGKPA